MDEVKKTEAGERKIASPAEPLERYGKGEMKKTEEEERKIASPAELLERYGKGEMKLKNPIKDGEETVATLKWDFGALTGAEYADALDMDRRAGNALRLSSTQALCLFAAAAAKATPQLSALDIRRRLGMADTMKAVQLTTIFFNVSSLEGDKRISNG